MHPNAIYKTANNSYMDLILVQYNFTQQVDNILFNEV